MKNPPVLPPEVEKNSHKISFYEAIDKTATAEAGKDLLEAYQIKWRQKKKNGGVNANTFDLFFALIRCVAPTMEDMKRNQPWLFDDCTEHGEYFCFTSIPHLKKLMNNLHQHKTLTVCTKTVYNQLKKLQDVGIITDKVNFISTGNRNPLAHEQDDKGRGRIQLWISPSVLKLNASYVASLDADNPSFFAHIEEQLPLVEQSSLIIKDKELKSIDNTPPVVDKAALPVGKFKPLSNQGKEQENKPKTAKSPNVAPEILKKNEVSKQIITKLMHQGLADVSKKEFSRQKIWDLARYNLYDNYQYNEETNKHCKELIGELLQIASNHVDSYRKGRIKQFVSNPAYLAAKDKDKTLKNFISKLPSLERASLEIVAHGIIKQRKYSEKRNNLHELYRPTEYFTSFSALQALEYSIADWQRIQENFFYKNKASKAYFEQVCWMSQKFSSVVEQLQTKGYQWTYTDLMTQYKKRVQELQQSPYLNEQQLKKLNDQFIHKFKPLFNEYINSNDKASKK